MIKRIVSFISVSSKEAENDRFRKRKELKGYYGTKKLPFREFYATDNDSLISDCLFFYFSSIRLFFPELWEYDTKSKPTNVLQSTVGFEALMKILRDILSTDNNIRFEKSAFDKYVKLFADLKLCDTNLFPMTTKGKKILYNSIFVRVFPNDISVAEKLSELESLR